MTIDSKTIRGQLTQVRKKLGRDWRKRYPPFVPDKQKRIMLPELHCSIKEAWIKNGRMHVVARVSNRGSGPSYNTRVHFYESGRRSKPFPLAGVKLARSERATLQAGESRDFRYSGAPPARGWQITAACFDALNDPLSFFDNIAPPALSLLRDRRPPGLPDPPAPLPSAPTKQILRLLVLGWREYAMSIDSSTGTETAVGPFYGLPEPVQQLMQPVPPPLQQWLEQQLLAMRPAAHWYRRRTDPTPARIKPRSRNYFAPGEAAPVTELHRIVKLPSYVDSYAPGDLGAVLECYVSSQDHPDAAETSVYLEALDAYNHQVLATAASTGAVSRGGWTPVRLRLTLPAQARLLRVRLRSRRQVASDHPLYDDGYFDRVNLRLCHRQIDGIDHFFQLT